VASLLDLLLGLDLDLDLDLVIVEAARRSTVGGDRAVPRLCLSLHLHQLESLASLNLTAVRENLGNLRVSSGLWHLAFKCRAFVVVEEVEVGAVVEAVVPPCSEGWLP
jgi:hypothetical protein